MITEDYVSFETAKLLKEKGFDGLCTAYYDCFTTDNFHCGNEPTDFNSIDTKIRDIVAAPSLQMAMKWLREVHHWHIFVIPKFEDVEYMPGEWQEEMVGYQYVIISVGEVNRKNNQPIITALTPESAYEAAIKYCLENLI